VTQPAQVTDPRDWAEMVQAATWTASRIDDLRDWIGGLRGGDDTAERDAAERDLEAERERERLDRLDYESDFDLDGDYDPQPDEPELDR
jgi:hypothetical protein